MPESAVDSLGLTHSKENSSESSEVPAEVQMKWIRLRQQCR